MATYRLFQLLIGFLLAVVIEARSAEPASAGFFYHEFPLTLAPGHRTEAAGPLYYHERTEDQRQWGIPPLFSRTDNTGVDATEVDFLYPVFTYDRFGSEYRYQFFQLLSLSGGHNLEKDVPKDRFTIFPFYFQQRSPEPSLNYTAFMPFYGHLKNRLLRDEIHFVMFPLYSQTRKRDIVTDNYVFPIFHLRHGNGLKGWQFWPLVGHEHKSVTTKTNSFDEVETVPGHDKFFAFWPFFFNNHLRLGTENPETQRVLLPLYSLTRSPMRDSSTYLWPFFTYTDDREKKYHEWGAPWPLIGFARGEGKTMNRLWPLFSRAHNDVLESNFYLWPVYKYNRARSEPLDRERTRILFFLYSDLIEKNTLTGAALHRTDLWPLFTARKDLNGNERVQILAPIEPLLPGNKSVERNWSPLWSLWRAEKNPKSGASSQSFLWNLYRHEETPQAKKSSLLFGLIQYQSTPEGARWRWFYLPAATSKKAVESPSPR
jgi:hypothetical protein